ncbi:polysaccharide deacetylase family protein [Streptomyces sp. ACA25]|uniref:polysaccharide deacetylase family protein n=1 Tax=Streptomyces sp. ACA25 TaxID=3022596 RepID=UPI0023080DAB|nr:polysaccharide deacetylase family protein [Streptomyces sp. ACA25]MDB1089986.1 polysaccharide deacetylase family protein [Streptomyces sp. ACA25]
MSDDTSDKTTIFPGKISRRAVIGAATCAGVLGINRVLTGPGADSAGGLSPHPGRPAAPSPEPSPPPSSGLRPFTGPPSRAVPVRAAAAETLAAPGHRIALTFDDGPHPEHTPQVLQILREYQVPATFFIIGENAARRPDLLRAIAADGHLVANHSWSHPQLDLIAADRVRQELGSTSELIADLLGAAPRWARAPYGAWDGPSLQICADLAMEPLGWSIDTHDWTMPGVTAISSAVLEGAHAGGIVLAHDGGGDRSDTVTALRYYLPRLLERGYALVRPD